MSSILFLGGCERSGTTMLASLLCGSEFCKSAPEAQFKFNLLGNGLFTNDDKNFLRKDFRFSLWSNQEFLDQLAIGKFKKYQFLQKLLDYRFTDTDYKYFIDHTPTNFSHYLELKRFYPNAKFLHIIRDGRAVYSSFNTLTWGPKDPIRAADWWSKKVGQGLAPLALGHDIYTVRYEDLIKNPHNTLKSICGWLGVQYSESMLKGENSFLPDYTKSQHQLVGQGISKGRLDHWKEKLNDKEIFLFQKRSAYLLKNLGYEIHATEYKGNIYSIPLAWINGWIKAKRLIKKQRKKERSFGVS